MEKRVIHPALSEKQSVWSRIWKFRYLHLMVLPGLAFYLIFRYVPMYGILIAFKNYRGAAGGLGTIWSSDWIGLKNFQIFFNSIYCGRLFYNTIIISVLRLIFSFPAPIILALMINEVRFSRYKRTVQTVTYMPYFLSWVVVAGLLNTLLSPENGVINELIQMAGGSPVYFLTSNTWFRPVLIISEVWKNMGYGSIVYLAAITSIDQSQYEAATVDGANKVQQIIHVTLPALSNIIAIMLILQIGRLFDDNFEQIINLYTPAVYAVSDVFETYIYRTGIKDAKFSYTAAIGLVKSVITLALILSSNRMAKRLGTDGLF